MVQQLAPLLVDVLLAVQDVRWRLKGQLTLAWKRVTSWQRAEPPELRSAVPPTLFRACIAVALLWGWFCWVDACLLMLVLRVLVKLLQPLGRVLIPYGY